MIFKIRKAIIEISKGSRKKNEIKATGANRIRSKVKKGFIANYGKISRTLAGDGNSVDVFVLGRRLKAGTEVAVIPYALIEYMDRGKEDNKVIAYAGKFTKRKNKQAARLINFLKGQEGMIAYRNDRSAERYLKEHSISKVSATEMF